MQGMGTIRLGRRAVMYTVETIPKGKNRVLGVSDRKNWELFGRELCGCTKGGRDWDGFP